MAKSPENKRAGKGGVVPPVQHRFQPGRSGNPGGRPSRKAITEAYRKIGDMSLEAFEKFVKKAGRRGLTVHEATAIGQYRAAHEGHTPAAKEIADRLEGRVPLMVKGELDVGNALRRAVELVNQRRRAAGK